MELLGAASVKDILNGTGRVPDWLDVDVFCDHLQETLTRLHNTHMFHRDLHEGNIMIRQTKEAPDDGKWGYIIDFGYSAYDLYDAEPYTEEKPSETFTYLKDDDIIKIIRETLKRP